jgi:apolipoprotein N-acyltransferase
MPEAGGAGVPAAAAAVAPGEDGAHLAGGAQGTPGTSRTPGTPRNARVTLALCALAGVLHALCFAPFYLPWLALVALAVPLGFGLSAARPRDAFLSAWVFGCGWLGVGLSWIYISLHHYGGLSAPFAALAAATLAAGLALLPGAALAVAATCGAPASTRRAVAIVAAWTLAEWFREIVFTGMPWLSTGYAHTDGPLAGYAPVLGVYGVGAVAATVAICAPWLWQNRAAFVGGAATNLPPLPLRRFAPAATALLIGLGLLGTGQLLRGIGWSHAAGAPIRVRLVQGNIAQDTKFGVGGMDEAVARYLPALHADAMRTAQDHADHAGAPRPDLIVLPESAFPLPVNDLPDDIVKVLTDPLQRDGAALIFGAFVVEPGERYFNSAIGLGTDGAEPQRYSKRHLVPFGEFVPWGFHWFVSLLHIPIGDQERGDARQPPMALARQQIAVNICFEDLFGGQIIDAWYDPQHQPTVLLNLSNLGWFDDSIALPQHLQISRMRALETARPLLRATNTGITALIDAQGRVVDQLPPLTQGFLEGMVQGTSGNTPFIRTGNQPILWVSALVLLACRALGRRAATGGAAAPVDRPPIDANDGHSRSARFMNPQDGPERRDPGPGSPRNSRLGKLEGKKG